MGWRDSRFVSNGRVCGPRGLQMLNLCLFGVFWGGVCGFSPVIHPIFHDFMAAASPDSMVMVKMNSWQPVGLSVCG